MSRHSCVGRNPSERRWTLPSRRDKQKAGEEGTEVEYPSSNARTSLVIARLHLSPSFLRRQESIRTKMDPAFAGVTSTRRVTRERAVTVCASIPSLAMRGRVRVGVRRCTGYENRMPPSCPSPALAGEGTHHGTAVLTMYRCIPERRVAIFY
jgi:hypothetical protein